MNRTAPAAVRVFLRGIPSHPNEYSDMLVAVGRSSKVVLELESLHDRTRGQPRLG